MKIEPLKSSEELLILYRLAEEIWEDTYRSILSREQFSYMLEMMYSPAVVKKELAEGIRYEFVKDDAGTPVGFLSFGAYREGEADTFKLHKLYLSSACHGKGNGSMMLQYVIGEVKKCGAKLLILNVNKQNARAVKAYRRNGFEIAKEETNDIGNGFVMDDYVMSRPI